LIEYSGHERGLLRPKAVKLPPPATAVAQEKAASHFSEMSTAFKSKAQQFADQVICDVQSTKDASDDVVDQSAQPLVPATEGQPSSADPSDPQAYRQENRLSEFGTKHIDPDTGLIYFKYDFGYEFGLVLPGEAQKVDKIETCIGKEGTIELPVLHEHTQERATENASAQDTVLNNQSDMPSFKPKKFAQFQATKWVPTTDSELSDHEAIYKAGPSRYYDERKQTYSKFQPNLLVADCSPSPQSLASVSPRDSLVTSIESKLTDYDPPSGATAPTQSKSAPFTDPGEK